MNFDNLPNELKQIIFKKRYESMLYDKNKKQYDRVINEFNLINKCIKDYTYRENMKPYNEKPLNKSSFYDYETDDNWENIERIWDWGLRHINCKLMDNDYKHKDLIDWAYYQKLIWNDEASYTKNIKIIMYISYICSRECDPQKNGFELDEYIKNKFIKRKEIIKLKLNRGKFKK